MHDRPFEMARDRLLVPGEVFPTASQLDIGFTRPAPALRLEELVHIERLLAFEHVVDGGAQFPGKDPKGLPFAVLRFKSSKVFLRGSVSPQEEAGRFGEGPLQMGVADLPSAGAQLFPRRFLGTPDKPAVGDKILHTWEPGDVVDLVEEHETQDLPHSGDGLEDVVAVGIINPGVAGQVELDLFEVLIVDVDQAEVGFDALFNAVVGEALTKIFPVGRVPEGSVDIGQVVLGVGVLDVGEQLGSLAHKEVAPTQQIAGGAHCLGVDVGKGHVPSAQEVGDLVGVDAIVFRLASVDRLHIEGMAQHEGQALPGAQIRDPVPGEHALHGDHQIFPEGGDHGEEGVRFGSEIFVDEDHALLVENADVD